MGSIRVLGGLVPIEFVVLRIRALGLPCLGFWFMYGLGFRLKVWVQGRRLWGP